MTFFPHLVAGPIMRPTELVPQFAEPRRATGQQCAFGLALMTLGLFEKIVLADSLLATGGRRGVRRHGGRRASLDAWIGTLAFSGQIFCDFAGYSTTAIGAALCLGFAMPDNFRFPYARDRVLRLLAALAHLAVVVAARLPLHPARRQPARRRRARTWR